MISTHILDTSLGVPAAGVTVRLEKQMAIPSSGNDWQTLSVEKTNADGRITFSVKPESGIFRLTFEIENYFKSVQLKPFFLTAPVTFQVTDISRKYHIPLLLNPFGYSTYRGS